MVRVGVLGAGGRMGQEVCRAVTAAPDLELVAAVDPAAKGRMVRDLLGDVDSEVEVAEGIDGVDQSQLDVAVDFTITDVARADLRWCSAHKVHAVVGTTGLDAADLEAVREQFAGSGANALVATNFALGAVLLLRFCELAAPLMDGIEIIELHHDAKRDAPSGTAMRTAERIAAARHRAGVADLPGDTTALAVLPGARGGEGPGGVRIHSVRLPGLIAHEEVVFGSTGQSLTVRHDSYDRRSFMDGVLLAVRNIARLPGLTIGLDPLLGF